MSKVEQALAWLEEARTDKDFNNLKRFGINPRNAIGVSMANIQRIARQLGKDHKLAQDLWKTGCYEARMLTAFVDDPAQVTGAQMDRWCRDFDNWGITDTLCFKLFDQTPHAWDKVEKWSVSEEEFVKRAGFALLASLAGHDKVATDQQFLTALELIESESGDDRHLVKKGISWALRRIGTRNPRLLAAARIVAKKLAQSKHPGSRWVGKDALRDLSKSKGKKQ
jgi:3-methyladenine DNA glycosylase AlkD